jgi:hypothetical protein
MKKIKFILVVCLITLLSFSIQAQNITSWEIKWDFYNARHEGLMILSGGIGTFRVKVINRSTGDLVDIIDQYVTTRTVRDGVELLFTHFSLWK